MAVPVVLRYQVFDAFKVSRSPSVPEAEKLPPTFRVVPANPAEYTSPDVPMVRLLVVVIVFPLKSRVPSVTFKLAELRAAAKVAVPEDLLIIMSPHVPPEGFMSWSDVPVRVRGWLSAVKVPAPVISLMISPWTVRGLDEASRVTPPVESMSMVRSPVTVTVGLLVERSRATGLLPPELNMRLPAMFHVPAPNRTMQVSDEVFRM